MSKNKSIIRLTSGTFLLILLIIKSCSVPTLSRFNEDSVQEITSDYQEIISTKSSITLAWNYYEDIPTDTYKLYYRKHGTPLWRSLDEISGTTPEFTVQFTSLGAGSWDFGVSAIDYSGSESEIHSCLDETADPITGWYLTWKEN